MWMQRTMLSQMTGRGHGVLCGRASAGLVALLRALGLEGGAVGLPAGTCYAVLWAALRAGCTPVLIDDALPPDDLRLQAVIATHLYGLPAPMSRWQTWADARQVILIEDGAQALGAAADGRPVGAWGAASIVSFGAGKIIDHGGGGAMLTDDERLAQECERVLAAMPLWDAQLARQAVEWEAIYWSLHRFEGTTPRLASLYPTLYALYSPLMTYRLPDSHWRGLSLALADVESDRARRLTAAARFDALVAASGGRLRTLPRAEGATVWKYPLLVDARDALLESLWNDGLHEVTCWYPSLRPMAAALRPELSFAPTPNADALGAAILNLPLDDGVTGCLRALERWLDSS